MDIGNIHPAFVHFPIALLFVYALLELIPFERWWPNVSWMTLKRGTLFIGTLSAIPTILTGFMAADIIGETDLVETHEHAALLTMGIFFILSGVHFWFTRNGGVITPLVQMGLRIGALVGLVGLFVVGSLGAAIVYGPEVDPIVNFITSILGLQ